jgi:hypothetical protein
LSRFAVLERRLFVSGHAFFGHRQDHSDAVIFAADTRESARTILATTAWSSQTRRFGALVGLGLDGHAAERERGGYRLERLGADRDADHARINASADGRRPIS